MTGPIRFIDIFWLFLGSDLSETLVYLVVSAAHPAASAMAAGLVGSAWILLGYGGIIGNRGWEPLRARFSPVDRSVLWGSAVAGVSLVFLFLFLTGILSCFGLDIRDSAPSPLLPDRLSQLPLAILLIAILGPMSEEVLFRGLLLDWLRQHAAPWVAVVVISVVFALLHDNEFKNGVTGWLAFSSRFLLGIVTSILAIRYRSLRPSFVLHGSYNGFICIASAAGW